MLYISRFVDPRQFGVVDTDDGVENLVRYADLYTANNLGLDIVGAEPDRLDEIFIHQPVETMSRQQVKTRTLLGVDVKIYNNEITNILLCDIQEPVTIRLSDYASACAGYILTGNDQGNGHKLTLVLDEKCRFSQYTWQVQPLLNFYAYVGVHGMGVKFDLRELNEGSARIFYNTVFTGNKAELFASVIDIEGRTSRLSRH